MAYCVLALLCLALAVSNVIVAVVVVVVYLYSVSRSTSNVLIVPLRCEKMSVQSRSEAVGTPSRVPKRVWKRASGDYVTGGHIYLKGMAFMSQGALRGPDFPPIIMQYCIILLNIKGKTLVDMMLSLTSSPLSLPVVQHCALVCLHYHVTRLLESNAYVRCLIVNFSKAFDTIDHVILLSKLKKG